MTKKARPDKWKKDNPFNQWCWENWTAICKRMKLEQFLTPFVYLSLPPYNRTVKVKVAQSRLTLWDLMDYTVHGILQARIPE